MKTGIKMKPCNVGAAEQHNSRDPEYCAAVDRKYGRTYFFDEYRHLNRTWINPDYDGISLPALYERMKKEVKDKTGRAMQTKERTIKNPKTGREKVIAGSSPIREGVCPIKPDTRLEDFNPFVEWLNSKGVEVIRIDLHRDEGHVEEGEFFCNNHAHVVCDYLDHKTGKSIKLSNADMKEMQTQLAKSLGMERGTPKEESGVEGLDILDYKNKAEEERLKKNQEKNQTLETQSQEMQKNIKEGENLLSVQNRALTKLGLRRKSDIEKENETLKEQLNTEKEGRAADKATAETAKNKAVQDEQNKYNKTIQTMKDNQSEAIKKAVEPYLADKQKLAIIEKMSTNEQFKQAGEALKGKVLTAHMEPYGFTGGEDDFDYRKQWFEPLCESMGCHQVPKTEFAIGRREGVAQRIVINAIRFFDTLHLDRIAKALKTMADDFSLPKYQAAKEAEAERTQRYQQRQSQEETQTRGLRR